MKPLRTCSTTLNPFLSQIFNVIVAFEYRANAGDASSYLVSTAVSLCCSAFSGTATIPFGDTFFFAAEIPSLLVNSLAVFLFLPQLQAVVLIVGAGLNFSRSAHDEVDFPFSSKRPEPDEADIDGFEQDSCCIQHRKEF
jgi:hypothetical protein